MSKNIVKVDIKASQNKVCGLLFFELPKNKPKYTAKYGKLQPDNFP